MSVLLLRLEGPLQAWGDSSRFSRRSTRTEPTKSGVLGLLAAAQGYRRSDSLEPLLGLSFGVRVDQRGQLMRDFQTARSLDGKRTMPLSYRYYLSDAAFIAGVQGPRPLIDSLAEAVSSPRYPLYLGRRSCPPSRPVLLDVTDDELTVALRGADWLAERKDWYRRRLPKLVQLPIIMDADAVPDGELEDRGNPRETIRDIPLSFSPTHRRYEWRNVVHLNPVAVDNPIGRDERDYLAALDGA